MFLWGNIFRDEELAYHGNSPAVIEVESGRGFGGSRLAGPEKPAAILRLVNL